MNKAVKKIVIWIYLLDDNEVQELVNMKKLNMSINIFFYNEYTFFKYGNNQVQN